MRNKFKKVFNVLVNICSNADELSDIIMKYDEETGVFRCTVILNTGEIIFEGYAWIAKNGEVLTRALDYYR